jgi:alpha-ketoglutarate-dependent taurine dioxygenase
MTTNSLPDRRAWRADTIDDKQAWYLCLPQSCRVILEQSIADWRRHPRPITEVMLPEALRANAARDLEPAIRVLESGRGFTILDRVPLEPYSVPEAQLSYWLVGQMLGVPFEQNIQGTLLYDVRDTGQDVSYGARFSVTNAESTFHTDNSFGASILDYVGLLCIRPAKQGGCSQVVSGVTVHEELRERYPEELAILYQPVHFDRRGGFRDGEAPTVAKPVITWDDREPVFRYLRYWIEAGHQKAGVPLTHAQVRALDVLDQVAGRPELRVEFDLQPGQMFFINNRWILHNRTAFEDFPDPAQRRHLVRLWLRSRTRP